jgi:hypothetical protein
MSATKLKPALRSAPIIQHWIGGRFASRGLDVSDRHRLRQ